MASLNRMKTYWIEGIIAGLVSFLIIWIIMLTEIKIGLILIDVPLTEYMLTSLFSVLIMGTAVGLLFACIEKYILFEKAAFKGIAFLGLFELLCIITFFFLPSRWSSVLQMYASPAAFVTDILLTVIIGGYIIGVTYKHLLKKNTRKKPKKE